MIYLMAQERAIEERKAEEDFKNQMFFSNPKMYEKLYIKAPEVSENEVQWIRPETMGEVADALNKLKEAGGPDLDFSFSESNDDWSFVDRMKEDQARREAHTQDSDSDPVGESDIPGTAPHHDENDLWDPEEE